MAVQKKKIIFLNQFARRMSPECGNDPYYDCKHYEKDISSEVFKKLWSKENFNKFRKKVGNKTIIPLILFGRDYYFRFIGENEENNYFQLNEIEPYYRGRLNVDGTERTIYYTAPQKPVKELVIDLKDEKFSGFVYNSFGLAVLPQYDQNSNIEYLVQLSFSDEKGRPEYSKPVFYHYKNGKWIVGRMLE